MPDKVDFRAKKITSDRGILCSDKRVSPTRLQSNPYMFAPNKEVAKCLKQTLIGLFQF